jgi:hypothetical protein
MRVFIYQPAKTAMQSGTGKTHQWVLKFDVGAPRFIEPIMGWSGSRNTQEQLILRFESKDEALAYAQKKGYTVELRDPNAREIKPKAYSNNFAASRVRYTDDANQQA